MRLEAIWRTLGDLARHRAWAPQASRVLVPFARGMRFADSYRKIAPDLPPSDDAEPYNPLRRYFEQNTTGPGIWKWVHYFDIYHRHFQKFRGTDVHIMEIGVYSGGSLAMWRDYFGEKCHVYGVDIEPACKAYQGERIDIFIGDQSDRKFWAEVRKAAPRIDIIVDDGDHLPDHQIVTLEEMLPHLSPGGVYLCEDTNGGPNYFASYAAGLASRLNGGPFGFAAMIDSVHSYIFVTVIEKRLRKIIKLPSEKRGTEWQPFFGGPARR
jgi:Methyltransferase domain